MIDEAHVHGASCQLLTKQTMQLVGGITGAHDRLGCANNQEAFCQIKLQCSISSSEARLIVFHNDFASTHLTNELQELAVLHLRVCVLAQQICQGLCIPI